MQRKIEKQQVIRWFKRLLVYLVGLYLMALGVVFSNKSGLGVGPVGSLPNVLYQIGQACGAPGFINLGNCTTAIYVLYIIGQKLLLRKEFPPSGYLQLLSSLLFGQLVNIASAMTAGLPNPETYLARLLYVLLSIPMVSGGVMLYLTPNLIPTAGDGIIIAIAKKTNLSLGTAKIVFDCSMTGISVIVSLIYFHRLVGVREGTLISALFVGFLLKQLQKLFQKPLLHFVEQVDKVSRALETAALGYQTDASGKPKVIITIGREFGSGGHEIGKRVAEKLGITLYDQQINDMVVEQSGIPLKVVQELEARMERTVLGDFRSAAYSMTNSMLSKEEELFVAQTAAIWQIASRDESCIIMGRCADYVLYDNPNCFRVFIHARPDARIKRTMLRYNLSYDEAKRQMENTDRSRSQHYRTFTGKEYGNQKNYHLSLDSGILGVEESAEAMIDVIQRWCDVRGTHPLEIPVR